MSRGKGLVRAAAATAAVLVMSQVAMAADPELMPAVPVPSRPLYMDPTTAGPSMPGNDTAGGTTVAPANTAAPTNTVAPAPANTGIPADANGTVPAGGGVRINGNNATGGVTGTGTVPGTGTGGPGAGSAPGTPGGAAGAITPAQQANAPTAVPAPEGVSPTTTPLMRLLEGVGPNGGAGKSLENAGINITGFVEGGYTYDFSSPPAHFISDRAFDIRHDSPVLNQVELLVQRQAGFSKPFDAGVYIEQMYGTDAAFIHSNGLSLLSNGKFDGPFAGTGSPFTIHPKAQYDPTQLYFTLTSNAAFNGIGFQGGKFATLLGYEVINPTANAFYSHSFIFTNEPYTQTGALGIVNLNKELTFKGGITRGWDQATEDTNGNIDFTGQLAYAPADSKGTLTISGVSGNEEPDVPPGFVGHNGYRTVFDVDATYKLSDQFTVAADAMYAWEGQTGNLGSGGGIGQWYGLAAYASYKFDEHVTFNARGEWYNDPDGASPALFSAIRRPNQFYEFTLGTTIHPFPNVDLLNNFMIRPEVRFDYADKASFDPIGGSATDHYFFTFAVDGVYAF